MASKQIETVIDKPLPPINGRLFIAKWTPGAFTLDIRDENCEIPKCHKEFGIGKLLPNGYGRYADLVCYQSLYISKAVREYWRMKTMLERLAETNDGEELHQLLKDLNAPVSTTVEVN